MNVELINISKVFNKDAENEVLALDNISTEFHAGEWVYVIGGNGSGKSTLLKSIIGELKIDSGKINFNNCLPDDIVFVDQATSKNLIPSMSIYENLIFGFKNAGVLPNLKFYKQNKYKEQIINVLAEFSLGLEKRLDEQVRFLSGGEQQIIVASRILLSSPKIIFMDEFSANLDQKWAPFILKKLKEYSLNNNIITIAVTHDFSQIENIGNRLVVMRNGKIIEDKKENTFNFTTNSILNLFYEIQ